MDFLDVWEKDETFFALRAAVTNEPATDRIRAIFQSQVVPALAAIVALVGPVLQNYLCAELE